MNSIKEQKKTFRKKIVDLKKTFSETDVLAASDIIFEHIENTKEFNRAIVILVYWSLPDEVHTHFFIDKWFGRKTIVLPLVVGDQLELRQFTGRDCLKPKPPFGIPEPVSSPRVSKEVVDLAIVPGVAFDGSLNRMGRGKGYYDRLLQNSKIFKIGVCFSFQMVDNLPVDGFDVKMDMVVHN